MSSIFNMPWTQAFDGAGNTLAGAKLYFYEAGTSTPQDVYSDAELTTALSNPVIADGGGRFVPIYLVDTNYKVALYTAENVLIWTADNIGTEEQTDDGTFAAQAVRATINAVGRFSQDLASSLPATVFMYANAATFYTDTSATDNSYVLEPVDGYDTISSSMTYFPGYKVQFVCTRPNTETALVQVNVNNHGAKYIRRFDGSNLRPGDMYGLVTLIYNGVNFLLLADNGMWNVGDIKTSVIDANHGDWLLCNGQAVSRTEYAALFAIIGDDFGAGDGSTTFNVPDYRGKFLRGLGGNSAADIYTTQDEGLPNHTHATGRQSTDNNGNFIWNNSNEDYVLGTKAGSAFWNGSESYNTTHSYDAGASVNTSLGYNYTLNTSLAKTDNLASDGVFGASQHVTPINMAVNYFIKAR